MGFTDVIEKLGISYESEEAYDLIDEILEHVSYAVSYTHLDVYKRQPTVRAISGLQEGDFVSITVVKRSGQREPYDANKINLAIEAATVGLDDNITWVTQIASELELTLFDGITTQQLSLIHI